MPILYVTTYNPEKSELGGAAWVDRKIIGALRQASDVEILTVEQLSRTGEQLPLHTRRSPVLLLLIAWRMVRRGECYQEAKFRFHRVWSPGLVQLTERAASMATVVTSQWPALLAAEGAGVAPDIHIAHNVDTVIARTYDPLPLRLIGNARRMEAAERRALRTAATVLAISSRDTERLNTWGMSARHLALLEYHERPPRRVQQHRIGFIGSLDWPPNVAALETLRCDVLPAAATRPLNSGANFSWWLLAGARST